MRQTSVGRKSSLNPVRVSTLGDKGSARGDPRKALKPRGSSVGDTQIPRPRIRSDSSDRGSIRPSTSRVTGISSLATPQTTLRPPNETSSLARGRSPSAERASVLGTTKGPKKDTRPLTDKNYQSLMLNRIDNFFSDAQKSSMLNPTGSLKPVSLKIFVTTSDFLLRLLGALDAKSELTLKNYMEDLPKISKKLRYPGTVAKSWLQTANTSHSFHHVLGWLSWLVELCEVKDLANQTFQFNILPFTDNGDGEAMNRSLFVSLLELYNVWNDGNEEGEKILEDKYINGIANQCGFTEEDIKKAKIELEETRKRMEKFVEIDEKITSELSSASEKLDMLIADENKQIAHISATEKYLNSINIEIQKLDNDAIILEKEKRKFEGEHDKLNEIINNQLMNIDERDVIVNQCNQIQGYMNSFNDHLEEIQKEAWALDMKVSKSRDQFDKAILAFNRDIVINVTNDIAGDLDVLKMPETFATLDIVEELRGKGETINNLKDRIKKELSNFEGFIESQSTKLETLMDKIRILDEEKNEMVLRNSETREWIKRLKRNAKEEEGKLQEMVLKIQGDIKELQATLPEVKGVEAELEEAREKLEAVVRRKSHLEAAAVRFFGQFFEILGGHKNDLLKLVNKE